MTKEGKKKWFNKKKKEETIENFIPPYLGNMVLPYHGDFCFSRIFHYKLLCQLCSEGFLPIATDGVLLPKLHAQRCVIALPTDLHISKSTRKKSKKYSVTVNRAFDQVIIGCQQQHGDRCWLYPPLVRAFKEINQRGHVNAEVFEDKGRRSTGRFCPVRLYSIEVWDSDKNLVAGELGYTVGSIYTSLTGFSSQDSAGSVQLCALGKMLCSLGFSMWDLGMEMTYKFSLGAKLMPREQFLNHVWSVREAKGFLVLPANQEALNAKSLIDEVPLCDAVQSKVEMEEANKTNAKEKVQTKHPSPSRKGCVPPEKKRSKNIQSTANI